MHKGRFFLKRLDFKVNLAIFGWFKREFLLTVVIFMFLNKSEP